MLDKMDQKREGQKAGLPLVPLQPSSDGARDGYCPICGRDGDPGLRRFGQLFCSEAHVAQYASDGRAKDAVVHAVPEATDAESKGTQGQGMACGMGTKGGLRKLGWCCAGGLGLLIAAPLIATGGLAAAAGSVLSVAALLACPIGMYFMMRGMRKMQGKEPPNDSEKQK